MSATKESKLAGKSLFEFLFTTHLNSSTIHNPYLPANKIISLVALSSSSLRALRCVCTTFKKWVRPYEAQALATIYFTYPAIYSDTREKVYDALSKVREAAVHLHIKVRPSHNLPRRPLQPDLNCLLHLEKLTQLTVTLLPDVSQALDFLPPNSNLDPEESNHLWTWSDLTPSETGSSTKPSHYRSLVHLREALEASVHILTKLDTITFTNISIAALQAFRDGSFASCKVSSGPQDTHMMNCQFWQQIRHLDISLVRWWDLKGTIEEREQEIEAHVIELGSLVLHKSEDASIKSGSLTSAQEKAFMPLSAEAADIYQGASTPMPRARVPNSSREKEYYRQGLLQLHSWLKKFSVTLISLTCTWIRPELTLIDLSHYGDGAMPSSTNSLNGNSRSDYNFTLRGRLEGYDKTLSPSSLAPRTSFRRCMGVHPLLLDKQAGGAWFSPPQICWPQLRALVLSGAATGGDQVSQLKSRAPMLKRLRVALDCVDPGVQSEGMGADRSGVLVAEIYLRERPECVGGDGDKENERYQTRGNGGAGKETVGRRAAKVGKAVYGLLAGRSSEGQEKWDSDENASHKEIRGPGPNTLEGRYGYLPHGR